jgi:hypothetical protein
MGKSLGISGTRNYLCTLEMGITRHDIVNILLGSLSNGLEQVDKMFFDISQLFAKP